MPWNPLSWLRVRKRDKSIERYVIENNCRDQRRVNVHHPLHFKHTHQNSSCGSDYDLASLLVSPTKCRFLHFVEFRKIIEASCTDNSNLERWIHLESRQHNSTHADLILPFLRSCSSVEAGLHYETCSAASLSLYAHNTFLKSRRLKRVQEQNQGKASRNSFRIECGDRSEIHIKYTKGTVGEDKPSPKML